jgi:hypothetical protein
MLNGGVDHRVVIEDLLEGTADVLPARVLGQVAACAGPQGGEHGPVVRVGGEDDDRAPRHAVAQQAGGLDAITAGHPQVHENDVREQLSGHRDGLVTVSGGTHDFDLRQQAEHHRQPFADHSLVVGDEDTDRLVHAGTRNSTRKPACVGAVVSSPPSSSARSRIPVRP